MHVRVSRVRRSGKEYAYPQLVESYRREDGVPAHRVVASLKGLSEQQVENIREALRAGREGKVIVAAADEGAKPVAPNANLDYLGVAVLLELAERGGLWGLLRALMPKGEATVIPADVVLALALQRCLDPSSKLAAERWFPRTALPELLGIAASTFNNTRLHRALDELEEVTPTLMRELPKLYLSQRKRPAFASLYMDLTDTYFTGRGPDIAARGKTKEGIQARKIGILLLCDEDGNPLRWTVLEGNHAESSAMLSVLQQVSRKEWAKQTPFVVDRAMGTTSVIERMHATGLHFVTALRSTEFHTYAPELPLGAFGQLEFIDGDADENLERVQSCAADNGFERVSPNMWLRDFNLVELGPRPSAQTVNGSLSKALQMAQEMEASVCAGTSRTYRAAAEALGITENMGKRYRKLLQLPDDIQTSILAQEAEHRSQKDMVRVLELPAEQQQAAYARLIAEETDARKGCRSTCASTSSRSQTSHEAGMQLRVVSYFNPQRCLDQHQNDRNRQASLDRFVEDLNRRLLAGRRDRKTSAIEAEVDRRLRRDSLVSAYETLVETVERADGTSRKQVTLRPVEKEWRRRRQTYGMSVLVAHGALPHSAAELCQLYRSKDRVEKDFQTIKSVTELRPVRHRNADKVSAHVTLCMLALVLERLLERELRGHCSPVKALAELETCHLNRFTSPKGRATYLLTEPTKEQRRLLKKLRASHLSDNAHVIKRIESRLCLQEKSKRS